MNGTIQAKKGFLYVVINYTDENGKTKYKWISTGLKERGNRKNAKTILERELKKKKKNLSESKNKTRRRKDVSQANKEQAQMLFCDYVEQYVDGLQTSVSPAVYYNYKTHYMKLFREFFDTRHLKLIDVTEKELNEFYNERRKHGVKNISLKHYNNVLRPVLRKAYKDKLILDNPFDFMEPIKKEKAIISFYDKKEMQKLFEVIKGHELEVPFMLAAYYGFRRSEVLGLRWSAIDFDHKLITINHKLTVVDKVPYFTDQLKTKTSYRTLPLIPAIADLLLQHRKKIAQNKEFYGNTYDTRYEDYVCVMENGKIVYPDHMTKKFSDLLAEHNLKHIRLHDLRHSCASNMLANGVPMKEIQEWLGHSNFSTTADVYSHLDFSSKMRAATAIATTYGDTKPVTANTEQESIKIFIQAVQEMKMLGFKNIDDYIKYKQTR